MSGAAAGYRVLDLGLIGYGRAILFQRRIVEEVIAGRSPGTLIICRHPSVITYGRCSKRENILAGPEELERLGVSVCFADRGGDVSYHGPGQLVFYPVLDLRRNKADLHLYLRGLEEVVITALRSGFGVCASRQPSLTGVWIGPAKVASIGIGVRKWVVYHGFSLNVMVDKRFFSLLKSCGLDTPMGSLADFLDTGVSWEELKLSLLEAFAGVFGGLKYV